MLKVAVTLLLASAVLSQIKIKPSESIPAPISSDVVVSALAAFDQVEFVKKFMNATDRSPTWTAQVYTDFAPNSVAFLNSKLGLTVGEVNLSAADFTPLNVNSQIFLAMFKICLFLPASLDLRVKYPSCTSIGLIRNQFNCGSCWAVSSMASLSDRYCIFYSNANGPAQRFFSYQDTTECATAAMGAAGCSGAQMHSGYQFAKNVGVSTGNENANSFLCKPYSLPGSAPGACQSTCTNTVNYVTPYSLDKFKIKSYGQISGLSLGSIVHNMMCAINRRGTIIAGFTVYQDFFTYSSGVYSHVSGAYAGRHAIRIIGWGVQAGTTPYWLCANSWGTGWGQAGFFKIKKGSNECSIENDVWEATF